MLSYVIVIFIEVAIVIFDLAPVSREGGGINENLALWTLVAKTWLEIKQYVRTSHLLFHSKWP